MTEPALTGAFVAIALGLVEVIKLMVTKGSGNGGTKGLAKTLAAVDRTTIATASRVAELWEAHKPVDGRYRWWFPTEMLEKQDEVLAELRKISGHLSRIELNGRAKH